MIGLFATWPTGVEALAVVAATLLAGWTLVRDRQEKRERRWATDARLSALAYVLRRQLRSWLDDAPGQLKAAGASGPAFHLTQEDLNETLKWAGRHSGSGQEFTRAEERIVELVATIPDASPKVADAIRRALVLFYQATGHLREQVALDEYGAASEPDLVAAVRELERCIAAHGRAVGADLQATEREVGS